MGGPIPTESNISMVGVGLIGRTTSGAGKSSRLDAASVRSLCSVYSTAQVDALLAGYQPLDADLTAIAALTTTTFGRSLLTQADAATARTTLGAGTGTIGGTVGATDNRLVRSDGTGAATVQSTGITVDDSNNVSGVGAMTFGSYTDITCPNGIAFITDGNRRIGLGYSGRGIQAASALTIGFSSTSTIDGSASDAYFVRNSASSIGVKGAAGIDGSLTAGAITSSALMCAGAYTVATLPSASSNAGKFAQVTDSSVTTFGSTVSGGGSNRVPVFSDGTNWVVA